jgi:hypothetical protein
MNVKIMNIQKNQITQRIQKNSTRTHVSYLFSRNKVKNLQGIPDPMPRSENLSPRKSRRDACYQRKAARRTCHLSLYQGTKKLPKMAVAMKGLGNQPEEAPTDPGQSNWTYIKKL